MRLLFLLTPVVVFGASRSLAGESPSKEEITAVIEQARKSWSVPGVAVVVVHDDRAVYLEGHGVKKLDGKEAVTPDTLFPMASCTKAFTTTALAMLVEQGKLRWDDPVRKHVPFFRLADPLADGQVTLRDLVAHRTGVAAHDFLWYRAPWPPAEAVRRLAHLRPFAPIRTRFAYQSTMFTAAGLAVASASGQPWDQVVKARIFTPLGMKSACCTSTQAEKNKDRAMGHVVDARGQLTEVPKWYPIKTPNAAGSVHASARDLTGWIRLHLNKGIVDGKRLVGQKQLAETHSPQMIIPRVGESKRLHPDTHLMCYGMGWVLQDYHGKQLISHAGIIDGFKVHVTLVSEAKLGLAILANRHATRMNLALSYLLVDRFLKVKQTRDWNHYLKAQLTEIEKEKQVKLRRRLAERHFGSKPSRELAAYVGEYKHAAYGTSRIALEGGRLSWRWNDFNCPMEHFHFDTFVIADEKLGRVELQFHLDAKGVVRTCHVGGPLNVEWRRK